MAYEDIDELLRRKRQLEATGRSFSENEVRGYVGGALTAKAAKDMESLRLANDMKLRRRGLNLQERGLTSDIAYRNDMLDLEEQKRSDQSLGGYLQTGMTFLGTDAGKSTTKWAGGKVGSLLDRARGGGTGAATAMPSAETSTAYAGEAGWQTDVGLEAAGGQTGTASGVGTGGESAGAASGSGGYSLGTGLTMAGFALGQGLSEANPRSKGVVTRTLGGKYLTTNDPLQSYANYKLGNEMTAGEKLDAAYDAGDKPGMKRQVISAQLDYVQPFASTFARKMTEKFGKTAGFFADPLGAMGKKFGEEVDDASVICTELHRQGYMTDEVLELDSEFRKTVSDNTYMGYRTLADPIVSLMKISKIATWITSLIALPWSKEMAHIIKPDKYKSNKFGKLIMKIGIPLCKWVGSKQEVVWLT